MSNILNNFYKNCNNSLEDIILKNCKNFLSYKSVSPSPRMKKVSQFNKNASFLFERIGKFKFSNKVLLKKLNLSKIIGRNRKYKNLIESKTFSNDVNKNKNNKFKPKYGTCDQKNINNENKNEKFDKIFNNFEQSNNKNKSLRKTQSARQIEDNKNIDQLFVKNKVNSIIKELLSKDNKKYKIKEDYSRNIFPLSKAINPKKYIKYNMQISPNNKELFKSYNKQIKFLMDEKIRSFLIEGINDYHENLKNYHDIYFDYFAINNYKRMKFNHNRIKNTILNGKTDSRSNIFKYKNLLYDSKKEKFKNNYIKAYNEKNFNKSNNLYFKYTNNNDIKKMISFEDRLKLAQNSSSENLAKYISKNTLKIFKKKYIL